MSFIKNFPKLSQNPKEAFSQIRQILIDNGFEYNNRVFMLGDVVQSKKGNCLGLSLLFGAVLAEQGFDVSYELAVNPQDAHYRNDIEQFNRAMRGDFFSYDELPDLPNEKADLPQGWFTPLEHPILIIDGEHYETTSLIDDDNIDGVHSYQSESRREITYQNLLGSSLTAKAKTTLQNGETNLQQAIEFVREGLELWPSDRQSWMLLYDLARHNFDDVLVEKSKEEFMKIGGDDSLYNFSLYEITGDEKYLDRSLYIYPAFIEAFIRRNIKLPLDSEDAKREARFNFTVAAVCVANSSEIDLLSFYISHGKIISEAFGSEYAADLLYDLEADNHCPIDYMLTMYQIKKDIGFLIQAFELGVLENSTPMDCLQFCKLIIENKRVVDVEIVIGCRNKIMELENKFSDSELFKKERGK